MILTLFIGFIVFLLFVFMLFVNSLGPKCPACCSKNINLQKNLKYKCMSCGYHFLHYEKTVNTNIFACTKCMSLTKQIQMSNAKYKCTVCGELNYDKEFDRYVPSKNNKFKKTIDKKVENNAVCYKDHLYAGDQLFHQKNYEEALRLYYKAFEYNNYSYEANTRIYNCIVNICGNEDIKKLLTSECFFKACIDECKSSPTSESFYFLGLSYYAADNHDYAITSFEQSLKFDRTKYACYYSIGLCYLHKNMIANAKECMGMLKYYDEEMYNALRAAIDELKQSCNNLVDYYKILEIPDGSSIEDIKKSYIDLVKVWHPDRFQHDINLKQKAENKMKDINEAYNKICSFLKN